HLAVCPDCRAAAAALSQDTGTRLSTSPGTPELAAAAAAYPGPELGPYELLEPLGAGGMGQVFKARHRILKRIDAVKCIHPDRARDPALVARFLQEAEAAARLHHPNVVTLYGADQAGEHYYLAMEFVPGPDLRRATRDRHPLPVGT